jgi:hypothetical protein
MIQRQSSSIAMQVKQRAKSSAEEGNLGAPAIMVSVARGRAIAANHRDVSKAWRMPHGARRPDQIVR